jgi:hypothetical protein
MAKDPIDLAGFDAENTGGLLSGFLAEEDEFDRRSLWRLGSWGVAAVTAVIVALMANQSSIGSRHDQIAAADLARQSQQIQTVAKDGQNEARRLASAIDTLNGDRDRLYSRLTVLEHGLDSVTGTVARQAPAAAPPEAVQTANPVPSPSPTATTSSPAPSPPAAPPTSMPSPTMPTSAMPASVPVAEEPSPPMQNPPSPPPSPPVMSPVATTPAITAEKTLLEATIADPGPATVASVTPTAPTVSAASPASARAASQATARPNPPRALAPKAPTARPNYATAKPPVVHFVQPEKPPSLIATAPIPEVVASAEAAARTGPDEQTLPPVAIQRTEFGVDVGGANSVNGLRALWRGLLKSRSNARLAALQPIIVIKESKTGLGMQLRLVAGPFSDAAEAAKICAFMAEHERPCETTVFDGQRLVMKVDETPAASPPAMTPDKLPETAKPAAHRHVGAKQVTPEEPPPPAEPPPLSFFGMRIGSGQ